MPANSMLLLIIFSLSCVHNVYPMAEFNLYHHCGKLIRMIRNDIKGALLYYERRDYGDISIGAPCTVELWGWFDNDVAMHFLSFNMTRADTYVEIRQGDSWDEGRPIKALCEKWEIPCDNGWCIDKDLKCNGYNPCGDFSDCDDPAISSGVIAVICVSVASGGTCILYIVYYSVKAIRKRYRRDPPSSITRQYAQSSMGRDMPTNDDEVEEPEEDLYTHNNVWNDDITVRDRTHFDRDTALINSQMNGYRVPGIRSNEPPSYRTVMSSDQEGSNVSDQHQNIGLQSSQGYDSALTDEHYVPSAPNRNEMENHNVPSAPAQTDLDDDNLAYLPSYTDVLQNEDAYRINLGQGNTVVYQV